MNLKKILPALVLGAALTASADGYKDGIEYYKAGQYANAKTILERNLNDAATDKAMAYYYLGQTALAQKDLAAAKDNFQKGVSANADCPYNYVGLGAIDLLNGDKKAAETQFSTAQKLGKKNNEITVDIARAYYNADPVKYSAEVDKLLAKAHKDSKNQEPSIYILEGDMLFDAKDLGGAAGKYEQAITWDKDNPEGYVKYANAYIGVNPIYSVNKLEELKAKQPQSALAQRELAEKYYETSQWTKAAQQYGEYIQNPNHFPEDKARYSVLLYANSEYQKSLDVANELLAQDPNNFVMNRIKMLDLAGLNQNEAADAAAKKFLALTPKGAEKFTPNDFITYAGVLEGMGQDSLAVFQYEAAVDADPTRADNIKTLSSAYNKAGMSQKAAEAFEKYMNARGEETDLNDQLQASGRWLVAASKAGDDEALRIADADKGIAAINAVINGVTDVKPDFYDRLATLYYVRANAATPEVVDTYEKCISLLDADPEAQTDPKKLNLYKKAYSFIGLYYRDVAGDKEKALENFDKADYYNNLATGGAAAQ
ncbi:MAG: hypothetical protein LIP09_01285 [Bacteroidales bacterium]|nr:hypothetical protein [Bacteroidales bacterium]